LKPEGSRIAVVFNGSPLFAGNAGSGESGIRRWIFENDWLEAVIALPDQLFYNTGLATYIWLLAGSKTAERKGKVQLINAAGFAEKMRRSLGAKRNQIPLARIDEICAIHREFQDGPHSRILRNQYFGFRRLTVERPLRLSFQARPERIRSLEAKYPPAVLEALASMDTTAVYHNQTAFDLALAAAFAQAGQKLGRTLSRRLREALSQQDDHADIYLDAKSRPVPDSALRDAEDVPLDTDVREWFEREVRPHAPDARMAEGPAPIGYAIPFARVFFQPEPVRSPAEIAREIRSLEEQAQVLLAELESA
jgi:type I restriction enzyme M protein